MKKILVPGHPGDLSLILVIPLEMLQAHRGNLSAEQLRAIAETTKEALLMWLGEIPVPEVQP